MRSVFFLSLMNGAAWGGSEETWFRMALWMCKNNYRVGIGCYDWEEKRDRINTLREAGCSIYLLPNKKGLFKKRAIKKVLDTIPFSDYGLIVINQGGWEEILHAPFKNLYKKLPHFIITSHNYNEQAVLSFFNQRLLRSWMENARMNFGATQKIFEVLEKKFNIIIDHKATLVNPITFQPGTAPASYPAINLEPCIWVMLAELDTARKAQDILIRALSSSKWKARNWQLHLYGKGKDKLMLEKLVSASGLDSKVFLKGFTTNIKQTLEQCHLVLQCTLIDAMPLSVVEAMAMGRPCVVSNVGDMPAWIEDGISGFICNDITEAGIDQALENCWQQKDNWEVLGKNAFDHFIKKYPQPYEEKIAEILNNYIR
jgi:glycosyltransferase involved in cell wall biosynthesis